MNKKFDIIYAPVITERTAALESEGKYVFKVDPRANKTEIKEAIESIFKVKVESITTSNSHPKKKRVGKYSGMTNKYKKAIVKLAKDNSISFN